MRSPITKIRSTAASPAMGHHAGRKRRSARGCLINGFGKGSTSEIAEKLNSRRLWVVGGFETAHYPALKGRDFQSRRKNPIKSIAASAGRAVHVSSPPSEYPVENKPWATCDPSRGCTVRGRAADWWGVSEATMRAGKDVVVEPGGELMIAFFG